MLVVLGVSYLVPRDEKNGKSIVKKIGKINKDKDIMHIHLKK